MLGLERLDDTIHDTAGRAVSDPKSDLALDVVGLNELGWNVHEPHQ